MTFITTAYPTKLSLSVKLDGKLLYSLSILSVLPNKNHAISYFCLVYAYMQNIVQK